MSCVIWGCAIILGTSWGALRILGTFLGYSRILGYHFFWGEFDFFKNNPDFWVLILIFCLTLWMILQFSFLFYYACVKSSILSITAISLS